MGLSDGELKITVINLLKAVMKNMGDTQEQLSHVSREMETLRKNWKESLGKL